MKFVYEYKTRDNERRSGECCAASRDAAFAELRKVGIKPYKMTLAPGLVNRLQSYGRRGMAIIVLSLIAMVAVVLALSFRQTAREAAQPWQPSAAYLALEENARGLVAVASNDYASARLNLRQAFSDGLNALGGDPREREAAMALYGELAMAIDNAEAESGSEKKFPDAVDGK